jgi:hypothetical protein
MLQNAFRTSRYGLLLMGSLAAWSGDFDQMIQTLKKTWPDKTVIAVVAEAASSKPKIDALAAACGAGMKITVVDVKGPQDLGKAVGTLSSQKPHVLVLIPGDRLAGDGQAGATFLMGVPWNEAGTVGALLGKRMVVNEFVAFIELGQLPALSAKAKLISTFALCGFANFSSIAIQVGGIGALVPERRGDLARLGFRAMLAGTLANFMSACIAGVLS